ncbi:mRNA-capping enzyme-like [Papaver somniferum]|uniref:mRNA-capping enzyme-like n=1 Tax=Papaver somniferum TaxID=3469 RepID=UPI000E7028D1|nr:mRNA-capping enzyme-like [Papaver somniferum]
MIISMDLNASSLPKDDKEEEEIFSAQVEEDIAHEEHIETAVETMHREREERRQRLKRHFPDEGPNQPRREPVINETRFYDKNKLPPGWLDFPASGDCIGYIIPSKVPLGETFNECIFPGKRYSLKQVLHQQKILGREVGLVIDLTNTTRYYQPSDWRKMGINHVKIACKGRDSVPDPESVNTFFYEVLKFYSRRQRESNKYILVHCTHGHNRTGFMIVHFLMRSTPLSVEKAIGAFHNARPPGIYKQDYVDALYAFYHERKPSNVICPNTPEWKRSSDDLDLNGEAMPDDEDIVTASQENQVLTNEHTNLF